MASMDLSAERRLYRRAPLAQELQHLPASLTKPVRVVDVSEGGARLIAQDSTGLASPVELMVPLLSRQGEIKICQIQGDIVRRTGNEVGVRFHRLLPRHFLQLRDYVWRATAM